MTQEEADKYYAELKKDYTDEEIAESCIFSVDMTQEDVQILKTAIDEQKRKRKLTDKEREEIANFLKNDICRIR
jgi:hypothetical protein